MREVCGHQAHCSVRCLGTSTFPPPSPPAAVRSWLQLWGRQVWCFVNFLLLFSTFLWAERDWDYNLRLFHFFPIYLYNILLGPEETIKTSLTPSVQGSGLMRKVTFFWNFNNLTPTLHLKCLILMDLKRFISSKI